MTETEILNLLKCMADKSRLQILKSLAQEDMYVERLAERLGVPGQNPPAVQSNQTPPRSLFRLSPVTLPISR